MYLFVVRCKIKSHKEVQKYDAGKHDTKRKIKRIFGGTTCLRYMEKGVECGNPRNGVRTEKN